LLSRSSDVTRSHYSPGRLVESCNTGGPSFVRRGAWNVRRTGAGRAAVINITFINAFIMLDATVISN